MTRFPTMTVTIALDKPIPCQADFACAKVVRPFKALFVVAVTDARQNKFLCGGCAVEEMQRRERVVAEEHRIAALSPVLEEAANAS